jgi:hypothetical protein
LLRRKFSRFSVGVHPFRETGSDSLKNRSESEWLSVNENHTVLWTVVQGLSAARLVVNSFGEGDAFPPRVMQKHPYDDVSILESSGCEDRPAALQTLSADLCSDDFAVEDYTFLDEVRGEIPFRDPRDLDPRSLFPSRETARCI